MNIIYKKYINRFIRTRQGPIWDKLHLDYMLLICVLALTVFGLFLLFSASNEATGVMSKQIIRLSLALVIMFVLAQIPPHKYYHAAPWLFIIGIGLLITVLIIGHIGKGAQRWLTIGLFRFQPSELMKIILPIMLAWLFSNKPLPPSKSLIGMALIIIIIPTLLTAKQPDLGTAIVIALAGLSVLFLSGIRWRYIISTMIICLLAAPILWHILHGYQQQRILTFLNPERDPLGTGYHIIQSKIAIGSGGIFGKGWLQGTQSHLQFLPEHATDFIFGVCGEELGLIGCIALILLYLVIVIRGLTISTNAQDTFTRLLAGSLTISFFLSFFINIGMVTGILPVVGLPLPMISYGGTAVLINLATFGILMSIHTHRKLLPG